MLSGIVGTKDDQGLPVASGGTPTVLEPWLVELERLTPTEYIYALDGIG